MATPFSWPYRTPGIPDSAFERIPGIPMSPREVRVLVLSQLRLGEDHCLWDIGAGTGTIAIEAAILCPRARVIAIERDAEVVSLIESNCEKFGLNNVQVIQGTAPDCLHQLSPPPRSHLYRRWPSPTGDPGGLLEPSQTQRQDCGDHQLSGGALRPLCRAGCRASSSCGGDPISREPPGTPRSQPTVAASGSHLCVKRGKIQLNLVRNPFIFFANPFAK